MPAGTQGFADITATGVPVTTTIGAKDLNFGPDPTITLPEGGLFVRAVSGLSTAFAVVKGQDTGDCYVANRSGTVTASQGPTYGNYCVALMILGAQVLVVWVSSTTTYSSRLFNAALVPAGAATVHAIPAQFVGTSQGFLDLNADGTPIWTDSRRTTTVKGLPLVYPVTRAGYWIGQGGGTLSAQICGVAPNGRYFTLYQGNAYEPHLALSASGTLYWASRTLEAGAQFGSFPPLPAFQGSTQGGSTGAADALAALGDTNLYPPVRQTVDERGGLMTKEWQRWTQEVSGVAAQALATANDVLQSGGVPDVTGVPPGAGTSSIQLTGDVTGGPSLSPVATTIAPHVVTYAKIQNVSAASRVLGRGSSAGAGTVQELTLGTGLIMTGTVLSSNAGGYVPLALGSEPLTFVSDGAGHPVLVPYTP